jgi:ribosomal protein S18 acetylase RimI-like enzyme
LRAADVPACAQIVAEEPLWKRYAVTAARARSLLRQGIRRRDGGIVAVLDGRVAGFVWYQPRGSFGHSGYIRWVATAPFARKMGVGARLMSAAEEAMRKYGRDVFLLVSHFNRRAQRFYERLGYRRVGTLTDYVRPGITEHVYRKVLEHQGGGQ